MADIQAVIAEAIKKADTSMFNENYLKQAGAVIQALQKSGYEIVPVKPPEGFLPFVNENMPFGRLRPSELVTQLYTLMVGNVRRFDK
ncbi:MAG: hypothetical protein WCF85_01535 [Rhodospirillaceae bacterium]